MKNTVKKVMAGVMAAAMMFSAAPMTENITAADFGIRAFAAENASDKAYTFNEDTGELRFLSNEYLDYEETIFPIADKVRKIYIGKDIDDSFNDFYANISFHWRSNRLINLEEFEVDSENSYYFVFDKALYEKYEDESILIAYPMASSDRNVYLPEKCMGSLHYIYPSIMTKRDISPEEEACYGEDYFTKFHKPERLNFYMTGEKQFENFFIDMDGWNMYPDIYITETQEYIEENALNYIPMYITLQSVFDYTSNLYFNEMKEIEEDFLENNDLEGYTGKQQFIILAREIIRVFEEKGYLDATEFTREDYDKIYNGSFFILNYETDEEAKAAYEKIMIENYGSMDAAYEAEKPYLEYYIDAMHFCLESPEPIKPLDDTVTVTASENTIEAGKSVNFTVEGKMPEGEYTWYVNGKEAGTGESFTIEKAEDGEYTVKAVATYPNGYTSESEEITVNVIKMTAKDKIDSFLKRIYEKTILNFIELVRLIIRKLFVKAN